MADQAARDQMVKHDLTQKVTPYLDRHFVIPLLEFLKERKVYDGKQVLEAQVDVLSQTNMVDYAIDFAKELSGTDDEPSYLVEKREEVLEDMADMQVKVKDLLELIDDEEKYAEMRKIKVVSEIIATFNLQPEAMDGLFQFAKFQYECGNYAMGAELLKHYRALTQADSQPGTLSKQLLALWGQLACHILDNEYDEAANLIAKLDEAYDASSSKLSRSELVLNRTWLLHWALFAVFQPQASREPGSAPPQHLLNSGAQKKLIEFILQDASLQTLSIAAPHLLRYVAALLIMNKQLQEHRSQELLGKMRQDRHWYSDPLTQFLEALYHDLDFDAAQQHLEACDAVLEVDFFLHGLRAEFKEHCRLLIFETYCRIHKHIKLSMLADKLAMSSEDAEVWIVKLIQQAKLDAKIDSATSRVSMTRSAPNVYQQVLDKTKNLAYRSGLVNASLDKRGSKIEGY